MSCYNTIPRNLRLRLQESLIDAISNALLEEFHILRTFDDVVDDIYDTFIKNRGRMYGLIYTGWKLNIETSECVKCRETENEDLYSIFVYWEANWNSNANATTDIRGIDINFKYNKSLFQLSKHNDYTFWEVDTDNYQSYDTIDEFRKKINIDGIRVEDLWDEVKKVDFAD